MASSHVPTSLHKYYPPERVDSLEKREVTFSPLSTFNDPFEGRPDIKGLVTEEHLVSSLLEKLPGAIEQRYNSLPPERKRLMSFAVFREKFLKMAETELPKDASKFHAVMTTMAKEMPGRMAQIMGALCLCETNDSLLMWAHYAKSHTGFVVEFDTSSPFFNQKRTDKDEHYHLRRVLYRSRRPTGQLIEFDGSELFLVKSDDWSYEKEWRVFAPLDHANRKIVLEDGTNLCLFSFPTQATRSITLGARSPKSVRDRVLSLAADSKDHQIAVYQATPSQSHFMLDFERLAI